MDSIEQKPDAPTQSISLDQKVAFLQNKDHYPHPTTCVKTLKTHMSWVFLTDQFVYKLKIPFQYDHMRLVTSKARLNNCLKELRLNKRLAESFYLGVVPLSINGDGNMIIGKGKWPIDWLLKMKRLPLEQMLDYRIHQHSLTMQDLEPAADLLSRFYMDAEPVEISAEQYQQKLLSDLQNYKNNLCLPFFELSEQQVKRLYKKQIEFIGANSRLFKKRVQNGKIIEAHGDLKPDHISLYPPAIIDCLEFDESLRIMDVFDDLAFLSLECDRMGVSWVGEYFINHYSDCSGNPLHKPLINFYKSFKAYIRAWLSIRHIREDQYRDDPKWRRKTRDYLSLASKYIDQAL